MSLQWPLMWNNITRQDRLAASNFFLEGDNHSLSSNRLTQGPQVSKFEQEFADWQGSRHAVFCNSGSSANLMSMAAIRAMYGEGEVIVPCVTWVSDIAAVLHAGLVPVFVDIAPSTLGMDPGEVANKITPRTRAVFLTHCLGFNALSVQLRDLLDDAAIPLVEDCCEALGATWEGAKVGRSGVMANFSFYYAHHMSTIEGGMVTTDDHDLYQRLRRLRAHGLVREMSDGQARDARAAEHPDLDPQFIFDEPAWNFRSSEVNAVIGRSQLKRLDLNNSERAGNLALWLGELDQSKYRTAYRVDGACNYALPLVLTHADEDLMRQVQDLLSHLGVEYRRGTAGGGNQLRQPYAKKLWRNAYLGYPQAEHVHFFGLYVGNYPGLPAEKILTLARELNRLPTARAAERASYSVIAA